MNKTDLYYYEIEYFFTSDKIYTTVVRASSLVNAIYAFNRSEDIVSVKLLDDAEIKHYAKCYKNSLYGQAVKEPDFTELAEKIAKNERRINDLEIYYNKLNARLNELWDKLNALEFNRNEDQE